MILSNWLIFLDIYLCRDLAAFRGRTMPQREAVARLEAICADFIVDHSGNVLLMQVCPIMHVCVLADWIEQASSMMMFGKPW